LTACLNALVQKAQVEADLREADDPVREFFLGRIYAAEEIALFMGLTLDRGGTDETKTVAS
jgi:hypothetical protein